MPNMFNFIFVWSLIALLFICNNIPSAHAKAIVNSGKNVVFHGIFFNNFMELFKKMMKQLGMRRSSHNMKPKY